MRRVIGIDIHRTFGEVVIWEDGGLRRVGRVDMTRTGLEGLGKSLLSTDEVVIEATGNCMAVSRVLSPFVRRVIIANPLQVKAIAHAPVKTDKVDAGTLASLFAAGFLPEIWTSPCCRQTGREKLPHKKPHNLYTNSAIVRRRKGESALRQIEFPARRPSAGR